MQTQDRPTSRASKEQERAEADARYFASRDAAWEAVEQKTARLKAMRLEREAAEQAVVAAKPVKKAAGRIRKH